MQPVLRLERLDEQLAADDLLPDQCDQDRVLVVVVKGVAAGDPLDDQPRAGIDQRGEISPASAELVAVGIAQMAPEGLGCECRDVEH